MTKIQTTAPRGRIVSGNPMKLEQKTNYNTKQPEFKDDGTPKMQTYFRVAIPKNDPGVPALFAALEGAANRMMLADQTGQKNPHSDPFAWKILDGDSLTFNDKNEQVQRPDHSRGCWLIEITNPGRCPKVVYWDGATYVELTNPDGIKTGDYVTVCLEVEPNNLAATQAGIYMNPGLVRFDQQGDAIAGGMGVGDAMAAFSGAAPAQVVNPLPTTPAVAQQAAPVMQQQVPVQQAAPVMQQQAPVQQAAPVMQGYQPDPQFTQPPVMQQQAPVQQPAPVNPTVQGNGQPPVQ